MVKKILIISVILSCLIAIPIYAAEFPTKEVQIIIPWAAGGATDLIFRALATTAATWIPARRAAAIDPMQTLRVD